MENLRSNRQRAKDAIGSIIVISLTVILFVWGSDIKALISVLPNSLMWLIVLAIIAVLAVVWFFETKAKAKAEKFVKQLDELGYFKYADQSDIDSLKKTFIKKFDPAAGLPSILDDKTHLPKDFRNFCDEDDAHEILELIRRLSPVFTKMNFRCEITNHFEEWDYENKWSNHRITINGTEYIIFKNFNDCDWGGEPFRIAQILNKELIKQNIDEQIYLAAHEYDIQIVLLSKEQYKLIYKTYQDKNSKPLEIYEWADNVELDIKPFDYWNE